MNLRTTHQVSRLSVAALAFAAALSASACGSKSAAEVSKGQLAEARSAYASATPGDPKKQVLDSFSHGNKVKLGSSVIDGATIEEWKYEAFNDHKGGKDLFVTFLYFCNDRFVDSSDSRIDFRNNPELVKRWSSAAGAR